MWAANSGASEWKLKHLNLQSAQIQIKTFRSQTSMFGLRTWALLYSMVSNIPVWIENMGSAVLYGHKHPCLDWEHGLYCSLWSQTSMFGLRTWALLYFMVSNIHVWTENMGSTVLYGPKHPCLDWEHGLWPHCSGGGIVAVGAHCKLLVRVVKICILYISSLKKSA